MQAALPDCRVSCVNDPICLEYFVKYDEDENNVVCQLYNILDDKASVRCLTDTIQTCETIKSKKSKINYRKM